VISSKNVLYCFSGGVNNCWFSCSCGSEVRVSIQSHVFSVCILYTCIYIVSYAVKGERHEVNIAKSLFDVTEVELETLELLSVVICLEL